MMEILLLLEFLKAVNLILEIVHNQIQRKKINALVEAAKLNNQCANCFEKSSKLKKLDD
jgi:hypothetical protein